MRRKFRLLILSGNSGIVAFNFLLLKASHGDTLVVEFHDIAVRIRTNLASTFFLPRNSETYLLLRTSGIHCLANIASSLGIKALADVGVRISTSGKRLN